MPAHPAPDRWRTGVSTPTSSELYGLSDKKIAIVEEADRSPRRPAGAAGLACMIAGSVLLVPTGSPEWYTHAEYKMNAFVALIVPSLVIGAFFVFALYKVAEARRRPPYSEMMEKEVAEALDWIDPKGHVIYNGERWAAESEEPIEGGEIVEVVGKERMVLKVRRKR